MTKYLVVSKLYYNFAANFNELLKTMATSNRLSVLQVAKNATEIFHKARWAYGIVVCPYCGSIHIKKYDGYRYKCNNCKNRFSDKTRTMLHGSRLPIETWVMGLYFMMVDKGQSSNELALKLKVNQKTAWLMQTKINYSLTQDVVMLQGIIAQDEMYVGGSLSNYHYRRKWDLLRENHLLKGDEVRYDRNQITTLNQILKQPVFGMTDGNKVVMYAIPNPIKKEYIRKAFKKHVAGDSIVVSDESQLYIDWEKATHTKLFTNNHHNNQYVTDNGLTSNAIENKFSWFKRPFNGKHTHCKDKYLQYYLNGYTFRYNTRNMGTEERMRTAIGMMADKHITYRELRELNHEAMFISKTKRAEMDKKERDRLKTIKWILENTDAKVFQSHNQYYTLADFK